MSIVLGIILEAEIMDTEIIGKTTGASHPVKSPQNISYKQT